MTSTVRRNFAANLASNAWLLILWVVVVPIYSNTLGLEAFGLVGLFVAIQAIVSQLDLGLSMTINRELAHCTVDAESAGNARNMVRTLATIYWAVAGLIGLGVIACSGVIARDWVQPEVLTPASVQKAVTLMGLALALQWPLAFYSGGLLGLQRQVLLAVINIIMFTVRFAGVIPILLYVSRTIHAFFLWNALTGFLHVAVLAVTLWILLPPSPDRPRFHMPSLHRVWEFAAGLWAIAALTAIMLHLDKMVLSKWLALATFGLYSLASLAAGAQFRLFQSVQNALYPKFVQLSSLGNVTDLRLLYHRGCQMMSVPTLALAGTAAVFSREALFVWTNDAETAARAWLILRLLMAGTALYGITSVPSILQLAHGKSRLLAIITLGATLFYIPALLILAHRYGSEGAAEAWLLVNVGLLLAIPPLTHIRLLPGATARWYWRDTILPFLAAFAVIIPAKLLIPSDLTRWTAAAAIGAVAITALLAAAFAAPEIRGVILEYFHKNSGADKCASA